MSTHYVALTGNEERETNLKQNLCDLIGQITARIVFFVFVVIIYTMADDTICESYKNKPQKYMISYFIFYLPHTIITLFNIYFNFKSQNYAILQDFEKQNLSFIKYGIILSNLWKFIGFLANITLLFS